MVDKATVAIVVAGMLLAACASPPPEPPATLAVQQVAAAPTSTPLPTSTAVPSGTPTITPSNEGCVRATTEIPEGQNPTRFMTSGPASGCYDSVGGFLDDIGLAWEDFAPGTVITFWTEWPVDEGGQVVHPTPTPIPISVTISPSMDDGFEYVCGHPPFTVDFSAQISGGSGELQYAWDFDGDGNVDASVQDPDPFTYQAPGVYNAKLTVSNGAGQASVAERRIVAIGEPQQPSWRYGVTAHLNLNFGSYANDSEVERAVQMIQDAGIHAVRVDFTWADIEPRRGEYNWSEYDRMVRIIRDHDLEILPIVGYSAQWASSGSGADWQDWFFSPPTDPATYGEYLAELVGRYGDRIHVWQIWGEPNVSTYFRGPSPATYASLLKQAYLAAKYADPTALVILGGLANDASAAYPGVTFMPPDAFLQGIYDYGGGQYFDAAARHPYATPNQDGFHYLDQQLSNFRQVMVLNGDSDKPIWITENGWPSYSQWTEAMQAQWLGDSYRYMAGLDYIGPIFWYNLTDKGTDPNEWEHNTGLVRRDWSPKPVYYAYQEFIASH